MFKTIPDTYQAAVIAAKELPLKSGTSAESIFSHFADQSWAMWLDSGNSDHVDSRFDILVWQPLATLTTHNNSTEICFKKGADVETSTEDPLLILKPLQAQLFKAPDSTHEFLPFLGGALGYFAYDLGRRFEQLPNVAKQDINLPEMAVGLYDRAVIFDKNSATFYLVCADAQRSEIESSLIKSVNVANRVNTNSFQLNTSWQANMDKASYIEKFNKVQRYLLSGDCYQINLAQRFSAQYQGDEFEAYLALKVANKAPFSAFIRLDNAAILSVSPERFLQCRHSKVQSKPIKGTMPRSPDKNQDRKNDDILHVYLFVCIAVPSI